MAPCLPLVKLGFTKSKNLTVGRTSIRLYSKLPFTSKTLREYSIFSSVLRFTLNSFSRISPSLGLFTHMMERIRICPRFKEFVMSFGTKTNEYDYSSPACKIRTSPTSSQLSHQSGVAENLQRLECLYGFRYVASTNDDDPWSIRQVAVYQNYDFSARKAVWTVVGASQPAEKLLRSRMETSSDKPSIVDIFSLHASLLDMSLADWRRLLWDLTEKVQKVVSQSVDTDEVHH